MIDKKGPQYWEDPKKEEDSLSLKEWTHHVRCSKAENQDSEVECEYTASKCGINNYFTCVDPRNRPCCPFIWNQEQIYHDDSAYIITKLFAEGNPNMTECHCDLPNHNKRPPFISLDD